MASAISAASTFQTHMQKVGQATRATINSINLSSIVAGLRAASDGSVAYTKSVTAAARSVDILQKAEQNLLRTKAALLKTQSDLTRLANLGQSPSNILAIDAGLLRANAQAAAVGVANQKLIQAQRGAQVAITDVTAAPPTPKASLPSIGLRAIRDTLFEVRLLAAAVAPLGDAVEKAREFDRAIRQIATITPDATLNMQQLSNQVSDLSLKLGVDAKEAADAFYLALSSGVPVENVKKFVEQAGELAIAGVGDLSKTVDLLTTAINAYGFDLQSVTALNDTFFETVRIGKITLDQLASSFGKVIPFARQAGVSLVEAEAALAAITSAGTSAAEGTTQLRQLLSDVISPGRQARGQAKALGLEFSVTALEAKGLARFLFEVVEATKGDEQALGRLFTNVRSLGAVLTLTGAQAGRFTGAIGDINRSSEVAATAAMKLRQGFDQVLKQLEAARDIGNIDLGKGLIDIAKAFLAVGESIEGAQLKIQAYFKVTQVFIGGLVAIAQSAYTVVKLVLDQVVALVKIVSVAIVSVIQGAYDFILNSALATGALLTGKIPEAIMFMKRAYNALGTEQESFGTTMSRLLSEQGDLIAKNLDENFRASTKLWEFTLQKAREYNTLLAQAEAATAEEAYRQLELQDNGPDNEGNRLAEDRFKGPGVGDRRAQEILNETQDEAEEAGRQTVKRIAQGASKAVKEMDEQGRYVNIYKSGQEGPERYRVFVNAGGEIVRGVADGVAKAAKDRSKEMADYIVEPFVRLADQVGRQVGETFTQFGLLFTQTGLGFAMASFSTDAAAATDRTSRLLAQSAAQRRAGEDRNANLPAYLRGAGFGNVPGFAQGGLVPGTGNSDSVLARLTPGEFVMNRTATARLLPQLQSINKTPVPVSTSSMNMTNNFSFGGAGSITPEQVRRYVIPEIKYQMRMGQF